MTELLIPNLQKERILEYVNMGKRFDGRKLNQYRNLEVELGISKNAESSVRVKLGKTEVLVGVKMGTATPYPDALNEGVLMTTAELHPLASNEFEIGKPGIDSVELARVIDRGVRESGFIDFEKLCIKEGELVWQVFLDIFALNDDGNLMDAANIACLIALGNARIPKYNEETKRIEHELTKQKLPLNEDALSLNMTFHKLGSGLLADVSKEEESLSSYRVSIAMGKKGSKHTITAMQKGKAGSINAEDMERILNLAEETCTTMYPIIKSHAFGK
jgi:exosome complex component RRP42